jgi:hypothetical protein
MYHHVITKTTLDSDLPEGVSVEVIASFKESQEEHFASVYKEDAKTEFKPLAELAAQAVFSAQCDRAFVQIADLGLKVRTQHFRNEVIRDQTIPVKTVYTAFSNDRKLTVRKIIVQYSITPEGI